MNESVSDRRHDEWRPISADPYASSRKDVKGILDDIKSTLSEYYSQLYYIQGKNIEEKIEYLRQYEYDTSYTHPRHHNRMNNLSRQISLPETGLEIPCLVQSSDNDSQHLSVTPEGGLSPKRPVVHKTIDSLRNAPMPSESQNFWGRAMRVKPENECGLSSSTPMMIRKQNSLQEKSHDEYMKSMTMSSDNVEAIYNLVENDITTEDKTNPLVPNLNGEIGDVINSLSQNMQEVTESLNRVERRIAKECDNPTKRMYLYSKTPSALRRPHLANAPATAKHLSQLYCDLNAQSELNDRRIRALQTNINLFKTNLSIKADAVSVGDHRDAR